jgi:hypothetical protein
MPRSNDNWASRQRQRFIEDYTATNGLINRQAITDYFGVEKSTASMDISAYIKAGGPIRRATRAENPAPMKTEIERGIGAGRPKGVGGYYVGTGGDGITGSTPERRAAWGLLPHGVAGGHRGWFAAIVGAYIADGGGAADPATYFGISEREAFRFPLGDFDADRAKVWGMFR